MGDSAAKRIYFNPFYILKLLCTIGPIYVVVNIQPIFMPVRSAVAGIP